MRTQGKKTKRQQQLHEWYVAHKEQHLDNGRKWRTVNRMRTKAYNDAYRVKHRELLNGRARDYRQIIRSKVFDHYGHICVGCGENDPFVLSIDHIGGGGNKHRRELGGLNRGGNTTYRWLIKNNFPQGFRVLCSNCQLRAKFGNPLSNEKIKGT